MHPAWAVRPLNGPGGPQREHGIARDAAGNLPEDVTFVGKHGREFLEYGYALLHGSAAVVGLKLRLIALGLPRHLPLEHRDDVGDDRGVNPAVLPEVHRGEMKAEDAHLEHEVLELLGKQAHVVAVELGLHFTELVEKLLRGVVGVLACILPITLSRVVDLLDADERIEGHVQPIADPLHRFVNAGKGEAAKKLADVAEIKPQEARAQPVGGGDRELGRDKRVPVAVAPGPESELDFGALGDEPVVIIACDGFDEPPLYAGGGVIEDVLEKPQQTLRLIEGRGFLLVHEAGLPELQEHAVDAAQVIRAKRIAEVGDDGEHLVGIELGGMRG